MKGKWRTGSGEEKNLGVNQASETFQEQDAYHQNPASAVEAASNFLLHFLTDTSELLYLHELFVLATAQVYRYTNCENYFVSNFIVDAGHYYVLHMIYLKLEF